MEHEAATRYAEMARRLRREGNPSLADVFEGLAAEERGHLASVVHWSEKERDKAPDPTLVCWKPPETFDDEGASTTDPRLLSAYRSLSMAVRNEERAFAFWTYVAAYAKDREIRRAAETMAGEELDHVATLRRERRRAYHADRAAARERKIPDAVEEMAALERHLAERLQLRAAAAQSMKAARLQKLALEAIAIAEELTRSPLPNNPSSPTGSSTTTTTAEGLSLFEQYHVHEQVHKALDRKVWLPSGGSLIIEHTEALTVIDVNTGKNVGTSSLEETVFHNNMEAADEIAKQLRLRDIGGIIVIDFIDMENRANRAAVVERFRNALSRDKTRSQVFDISDLGLVEMTRKRIGEGLLTEFSEICPECEGRGVIVDHALLD